MEVDEKEMGESQQRLAGAVVIHREMECPKVATEAEA